MAMLLFQGNIEVLLATSFCADTPSADVRSEVVLAYFLST